MAAQRLIFVYNADGGLLNAARDVWHRITSPSTYPCSLCALTYGAGGMHKQWREFTETLPMPAEFWHRDEFRRRAADSPMRDVELPVALLDNDGRLTELVSAGQMRGARSLPALIELVTDALRGEGEAA